MIESLDSVYPQFSQRLSKKKPAASLRSFNKLRICSLKLGDVVRNRYTKNLWAAA